MNREALNELCEMQKRFKKIYEGTGLCGMTDEYVHLSERAFRDIFSDNEISKKERSGKFDELFAYIDGVRIIALADKEDDECSGV